MTKFAERFFLILLLLMLFIFLGCSTSDQKHFIEGEAQGTTYHITYYSPANESWQAEIDSLLMELDLSLSTYNSRSLITRINNNDTSVRVDQYFAEVFKKSVDVAQKTDGLFDVTVAPIINAYGFGFTKKASMTTARVDSLLNFVGYKMVKLEEAKIVKSNPNMMLDFNAIGQGYSVDVLAAFLEGKGVKNYLVELGGELKAKGTKANSEPWTVGIDQPQENATERFLQASLKIKNKAMATSGNYRRFYEEDGRKYTHIINPKTGYPEKHNLISVSVVANDCMTADAYATAFMVMGFEKSKQFLADNKSLGLEVYFIYDQLGEWKTYTSPGLAGLIDEH